MMDTTKKSLGDMSIAELAAIPGGDVLLPKQKRSRDRSKQQEIERAEREQQNREIGGRPPAEPAIPGDVFQQARLPRLAAVEIILQRHPVERTTDHLGRDSN
jgi:hypothetical protein